MFILVEILQSLQLITGLKLWAGGTATKPLLLAALSYLAPGVATPLPTPPTP